MVELRFSLQPNGLLSGRKSDVNDDVRHTQEHLVMMRAGVIEYHSKVNLRQLVNLGGGANIKVSRY